MLFIFFSILDTVVGVRERLRQKINTTTAVESSKDDLQFILNPNIPYEVSVIISVEIDRDI